VLSLFPFVPDPRYRPDETPPASATFDVVFIGRLSVAKGVPLLVDAVRRLAHDDLRLVLVGGWSSRGMRRFLQDAVARDSRISIGPGDPLPHLRRARLCAHPTYEDGFAYAPAEAMACGVPILVSEDTGMKDLIDPGVDGLILPTGDLSALTEAIEAAYRGEIFP
jgi:glycosyltransferase involved in cell wall biosynthesis